MYFSKWFKDIIIFVDKQDRWALKYVNAKGLDEIHHDEATYFVKGAKPPLSSGGKALFIFSEGNPNPKSLAHSEAKDIDGKTIMSIVNNKIMQVLMSLQGGFMSMQYITVIASCISALASVLVALKMFGVIK